MGPILHQHNSLSESRTAGHRGEPERRLSITALLLTLVLCVLLAAWYGWRIQQPVEQPLDRSSPLLSLLSDGSQSLAPLPQQALQADARVRLGARLFADGGLSPKGMSCASCHDPATYFTLPVALSPTADGSPGRSNIPTLLNSGLAIAFSRSGRHASLQSQSDAVIENTHEMASSWSFVETYLGTHDSYPALFREVFQRPPDRQGVLDALAAYQEFLITPNAPFDRYLRGETAALTPAQKAGWRYFQDFGCVACHQGTWVGGNLFSPFGVFEQPPEEQEHEHREQGEDRSNVTGDPVDEHVFKVPSLRNVARTAPYFHDGSAAELEDAVETMARYQLGKRLQDEEITSIVAFLESLNGEVPTITP